jgi:hypothetical protein
MIPVKRGPYAHLGISISASGSVYLLRNNILTARDTGFGAVVTSGLVRRQKPQAKELLGITNDHIMTCVIPLEKRTKELQLRRRPEEEFATCEHFAGPVFRSGNHQ